MKSNVRPTLARVLAAMCLIALTLVLMAVMPLSAGAEEEWVCFPSCNEKDSRFLVLAGTELQTLAGDSIEVELVSLKSNPNLTFAVFDGETSGRWDRGSTPSMFTLFADPLGDGSGTEIVTQSLGSAMTDNHWFTFTIPNLSTAIGKNQNFYYTLRVTNTNYNVYNQNAFKVRTDGTAAMSPQVFAFISSIGDDWEADYRDIYPSWPALTETTYDGEWNFYLNVTGTTSSLVVWDGDLDFGNATYDYATKTYSCTIFDTNDPDTSDTILPPWALGTAAWLEGVPVGQACSTGYPADDSPWASGRRSPSVQYEVIDPNGTKYLNANPSGNREWEQFRILYATVPNTPTVPITDLADHYVDAPLPAGQYRVRVFGVDVSNLNAFRFSNPTQCIDANNNPCSPLDFFGTSNIGDRVWYDLNNSGGPDDGSEPGIPSVRVTLLADFDNNGTVDYTYATWTDANGNYLFRNLITGTFTVVVDPPAGLAQTYDRDGTGTPHRAVVNLLIDQNILDVDFGYRGTGTIGDRVWLDLNNSGGPDDGSEPGLAGVGVTLKSNLGYQAATTTNSNGGYSFQNLVAGTYTVTVNSGALPSGMQHQTYDVQGPLDNAATVPLSAGQNRADVDFGYFGVPALASLGDTVWLDSDADGKYEPEVGELPIQNVVLRLQTGDEETTNSAGWYKYASIPAGSYTVSVQVGTLPPGLTPTWDYDGITTAHVSLVNLPGGVDNMNVDFGYRPTAPLGTGTPGYWKNHPAWPVSSITLGGVVYTKAQAIEIIKKATERDVTMIIAQALISAKLNVGLGNPSGCIEQTIRDADAWLAQNAVGSGVKGSSAAWRVGEPLSQQLDAYNNGLLCAPSRDTVPSSGGVTATSSDTKTSKAKR